LRLKGASSSAPKRITGSLATHPLGPVGRGHYRDRSQQTQGNREYKILGLREQKTKSMKDEDWHT